MDERWTRHTVRLSWGRLAAYACGEGPPLLLVHGLGGSGRYWAGLAPHLAAHRTLIAPDLPGFGRSDKPHATYSRAFHLEAVDGLLASLGVTGGFSVAGHSMGGILAALVAARHPDRVDALAVVAAPYPREQVRPLRVPRSIRGRLLYRFAQGTLPLLSPLVRSATFPRAVVADYLRHTLESYQRTSHALIWDVATAGELASLAAATAPPVLLLFSAEDTTISPDSLQRWQAQVPRAEVALRPGGHQLLLRGGFAALAAWFADGPAARVA